MTREHVIPASLGGRLVSRFLCKACNSQLGHLVEGRARTDPTVQLLAAELAERNPKLSDRLAEGQSFVVIGPGPRSTGRIKGGEFVAGFSKLEDGSLVQPTNVARRTLGALLAREGLSEPLIKAALGQFDAAADNSMVELSSSLRAVKWAVTGLQPALDGPLLDPVVALKIAYEFLALHLGHDVYQGVPALRSIRLALQTGSIETNDVEVERLHAPEGKPIHGLLFEGNDPHAKVKIRLFGKLAFRVHFRRLAVDGPRGLYTHDLVTNEEQIASLASKDD